MVTPTLLIIRYPMARLTLVTHSFAHLGITAMKSVQYWLDLDMHCSRRPIEFYTREGKEINN